MNGKDLPTELSVSSCRCISVPGVPQPKTDSVRPNPSLRAIVSKRDIELLKFEVELLELSRELAAVPIVVEIEQFSSSWPHWLRTSRRTGSVMFPLNQLSTKVSGTIFPAPLQSAGRLCRTPVHVARLVTWVFQQILAEGREPIAAIFLLIVVANTTLSSAPHPRSSWSGAPVFLPRRCMTEAWVHFRAAATVMKHLGGVKGRSTVASMCVWILGQFEYAFCGCSL